MSNAEFDLMVAAIAKALDHIDTTDEELAKIDFEDETLPHVQVLRARGERVEL